MFDAHDKSYSACGEARERVDDSRRIGSRRGESGRSRLVEPSLGAAPRFSSLS